MSTLKAIFSFIKTTLKHKFFVMRIGLHLRVPFWQLLIHDLSKFKPFELTRYAKAFSGGGSDTEEFNKAWNHHQNHNPHHWEYWFVLSAHNKKTQPQCTPLPMPERYVREMVADWVSACRAYEGYYPLGEEDWPWLKENILNIRRHVHPKTKMLIHKVLSEYFYGVRILL